MKKKKIFFFHFLFYETKNKKNSVKERTYIFISFLSKTKHR